MSGRTDDQELSASNFTLCVSRLYRGTCPTLLSNTHPVLQHLQLVAKQHLNITINPAELTIWRVGNSKFEKQLLEDHCDVEWDCGALCKENFRPACPWGWQLNKTMCQPKRIKTNACGLDEGIK
eukprot:Gregarina_sp_Poly_1__9901@NODE_646_length_6978_cov_73_701490_g492_i0_p6_GENE_NODE_646_length_6978_cov_73_701490_g492_i0NODE_646_length_6978_cov_73_701490_g492_i0_p6_ORF_typecomplete_len124_score13_55CPW_WPC/PF09717_10/0_082CPW_WPC/PF09717_10/0_037_NODE_646_length_6978_cov_73_701490_g492_i042264597